MNELVEYRIKVAAECIEKMVKEELFPIMHKNELIDLMVSTFYEYGFEEQVIDNGYDWTLEPSYCQNKWKQIIRKLEEKRILIAYVRELRQSGFKGMWKVCNRNEFETAMRFTNSDLHTREEEYNERITAGNSTWKSFNMPLAEPVKQIN